MRNDFANKQIEKKCALRLEFEEKKYYLHQV